MPSKPSTSKSKPTLASKPKQSAESKAEKRKQTNEYKAAKAAAVGNVDTVDSDSDEEVEDKRKDENEKKIQPKAALGMVTRSLMTKNPIKKNGIAPSVGIKSKPDPKVVGKNWSVAKFMELDGEGNEEMYNAITTYARTILLAEVKDLENPIWSNVNTDMRSRLNIKLKLRHPYLHRFKDNAASEEIFKRILRNHRDTKSRIKRAGGHTEWKAKEKAKREARKAKQIDKAISESSSKAKRTSEKSPMPTHADDDLPTTSMPATSTAPNSRLDDKAKELDQMASPNTKEKNKALDTNKKGKKRAEPTTDDDDQVFSDVDQPQASTQKKRRLQIDDDTDSESSNLPVERSRNTAMGAVSSSKKRKSTPEADQDQEVMSNALGNTNQSTLLSDRSLKRARHISPESDSEGEEQARTEGINAPSDQGRSGGEGNWRKSGNGRGKDEEEEGSDKEGSKSEGEGEEDEGEDKDEDEDEEDEDEELARQMVELKKRMAASRKKKTARNPSPPPAIPLNKRPQRPGAGDFPPASSILASNTPAISESHPLASTPKRPLPASSTIASSTLPSPDHDRLASQKPRPRPKMRPVQLESVSETMSTPSTAVSGEQQPPREPTPALAPPKAKAAPRPTKGVKVGTKATSRKVKEELIESVEAGSNTPEKNSRRQLRPRL